MQSLDLATLTRLLNALAGVAGGVATPTIGDWLAKYAPAPFDRLGRQAATVSGVAWAGASLVDVLAWLRSSSEIQAQPLPHPTAIPAADDLAGQLALWRQLNQQP